MCCDTTFCGISISNNKLRLILEYWVTFMQNIANKDRIVGRSYFEQFGTNLMS